jgi:hypothetical protein
LGLAIPEEYDIVAARAEAHRRSDPWLYAAHPVAFGAISSHPQHVGEHDANNESKEEL